VRKCSSDMKMFTFFLRFYTSLKVNKRYHTHPNTNFTFTHFWGYFFEEVVYVRRF
jgi:hypothetical protein